MFDFSTCKTGLYSSSQRAVSATLGLACSISLAAPAAMAHVPAPAPPVAVSSWQMASPTLSSTHSGTLLKSPVTSLFHGNSSSSRGLAQAGTSSGALNLASSTLSYLAGNLANFSSLTIDVGGRQEQVALNTKLTGAEVIAVEQVLTTGSQSLTLSASGVATGGTVSLNSNLLSALDSSLGGSVSSLTIARGVQVVDSLSVLSLSGSLSNYGSILTAAGTSGTSDTITAGSILNATGAAIGSYVGAGAGSTGSAGGTGSTGSTGGSGGNTGGNVLFGASTVLNASTSLTNNGSISSSGNLTVTAPVVYNVASHGSTPSMTAAQNVNINTQNLNNSGLIAAGTGNVNVVSAAGLNLAGAGGTLQAKVGSINLSGGNADIDVSGGNMLSQQVNLNAGTGNVSADLDQVTGVVNASGYNVHINGNSANLNLGTIDAAGDPTFTNTANLTIDSGITALPGSALTLIAGGNIVSDSGNTGLVTTSSKGAGGQLNLIAGAAFTPTGTAGINTTATASVKVTGASASGGVIDLSGGNGGDGTPIAFINTSSTDTKAEAGGAIQMVAFVGTASGTGGSVIIPNNVTINAGSTAGTAGNVTIIAGATSGAAVTTGPIIGKTITVDTATPTSTGVTFASDGVASGTFTAATTYHAANISLGNVDASGTLIINSTGSAAVSNSTTALNLGTVNLGTIGTFTATNSGSGTNGNINIDGIVTGNQISISAAGTGTVTVTKTITASGLSVSNPSVSIVGGANSGDAVVIGAAVSGNTIDIGLTATSTGNIALNDPVGTKTSTLTTASTTITAGNATTGGEITGTGIVSGENITLGGFGSVGTPAKPIVTQAGTMAAAGTLSIAPSGGGVFVAQKGDLLLSSSDAGDLVLKVTGTLDVMGTVNAPALSLTSTGTTTIAAGGSITNTGTAPQGAMVITSGGAFTINAGGSIQTTADLQSVTINVTGAATINGTNGTPTISVQTLNLNTSGALTIAANGSLADGADNISAKGIITVSGQLSDSMIDMTTTKALTIASPSGDFVVGAGGSITALTITIAAGTTASGSIDYTATSTGNAFINNGTVNGQTVTVNTTSTSGIVDNASAASILEATQQSLPTAVPILTLNTRIISNQGTVEALGAVNDTNGTLNIISSGTLIISGINGGFQTNQNFFSAVNITAKGNITVGSATANPFSNLTAANDLGSFSINTSTGDIFTSPMTGISVATNNAGTVGGTIAITAGSFAYNGPGTTSAFLLTANGAPGGSVGKNPITVDLTGAKGLTIGGTAGDIQITTANFDNTSVLTLTTPGALTINTGFLPTIATNAMSLNVTGTKSLLISGNLDEGTTTGTSVTLTTSSGSSFLIGGATTNGQSGINQGGAGGQGITAYQLTINSPGLVVLGAGTLTSLGAVLNGTNGVNINGKGLTVDDFANVVASGANSTGLTVTAATGSLSYINLNATGLIGTSVVNLNDPTGTLTLGSGTTPTVLSVSNLVTNGGTPLTFGGTFNINAESLSFGSGGILFNAFSSQNGGQVNLNLTGATTVKVGTGSGNISANVEDGKSYDEVAADSGLFSLTTNGSIVATNIYDAATPANSAILFGAVGSGQLTLNAAGTSGKVSIANITGISLDSLSLTSHSTTSFVLSGATGANGIIDGKTGSPPASLTVGDLSVSNSGEVITNGVVLQSGLQQLALTSLTSISVSANNGFTVGPFSLAAGGTSGGIITLSAPTLIIGQSGLPLTANGGTTSGGSISVSTTTTPVTVGSGSGLIAFNVSNIVDNIGGSVQVVSAGGLTVDAGAINLGSNFLAGFGANLTLAANGGALIISNAASFASLGLQSIALTSHSSRAFVLGGALTNGIADSGLAISAAKISIANGAGSIANGTLASLNGTSSITLTASTDIGATGAGNQVLLVGTPNLILNAGGSAYISASATTDITSANVAGAIQVASTAGDLTVGGAGKNPLPFSAGSVTINYTNANAANTNSVTIDSIGTTNGDLTVTSNAQNLVVGDGTNAASIGTTNGNITLLNTSTNGAANILVNAGATILGSGAIGNLNEGNVNIVMGQVPGSPIQGLAPTTNPPIASQTDGGEVFWGTNSITTGPSVVLNAFGRNIVFNTATFLASAITLDANVTITADPPASATISQVAPNTLSALNNLPAMAATPAGTGNLATDSASITPAAILAVWSANASASPPASINAGISLSGNSASAGGSSAAWINNPSLAAMSVGNAGIGAGLFSGTGNSATVQNAKEDIFESNIDSGNSAAAASTNGCGNSSGFANTNGSAGSTGIGGTNSSGLLSKRSGAVSNKAYGIVDQGRFPLTGRVSNSSHRCLDRGPLFLSPEQNEVVETPFGSVSVAAGSVALIISSDRGLAVYDLHDGRKNAVVINSGTTAVALVPGRSAILTRSAAKSFEEVNPAPFVSYRHLASRDVSSETKLYHAEFEITSMVRGLPAIRHLMASDSAKTRQTMSNMLKTAAILMQLSRSSEPYILYLAPKLTAYLSSAQK